MKSLKKIIHNIVNGIKNALDLFPKVTFDFIVAGYIFIAVIGGVCLGMWATVFYAEKIETEKNKVITSLQQENKLLNDQLINYSETIVEQTKRLAELQNVGG